MEISTNATNSKWKSLIRIIDRFVFWIPRVWLFIFSIFVLLVTLQVGHLPTYGQPDPKFAGAVSIIFYNPVMLLLVLVIITTPIGVIWSVGKLLWNARQKSHISREAIFCLVGLGLFWAITRYDTVGLMDWLFD